MINTVVKYSTLVVLVAGGLFVAPANGVETAAISSLTVQSELAKGGRLGRPSANSGYYQDGTVEPSYGSLPPVLPGGYGPGLPPVLPNGYGPGVPPVLPNGFGPGLPPVPANGYGPGISPISPEVYRR